MNDEQRRTLGWGGWLLRAFGVLVGVWLIAPVIVFIPVSFAAKASFKFPPDGWSMQWYETLFTDEIWRESFTNSLQVALFVVVVSVIMGTACALGLERSRFRAKAVVRGLIISPIIVPLVVFGGGTYAVFLNWKLVGSLAGFVIAHLVLAVPLVVASVSASLGGFDQRLEAAAISLGASRFAAFRTITLPLILPGVLVGAAFAFITSFDEVVVATLISNAFFRTLPVLMFTSVETVDPTVAAASTVLLAITTAIIALALLSRARLERRSADR